MFGNAKMLYESPGGNQVSPLSVPASSDPTANGGTPPPDHTFSPTRIIPGTGQKWVVFDHF